MKNKKQSVRLQLDNELIDYIDMRKSEGFSSRGDALTSILIEHMELKNKLFDLEFLVHQFKQEMAVLMDELLKKNVDTELKRIRLGTNNTDRNTQILIELLQGFMILKNINQIPTTKDYKPQFLINVEEVVKERITHLKQKKHSKEVKKVKENENV